MLGLALSRTVRELREQLAEAKDCTTYWYDAHNQLMDSLNIAREERDKAHHTNAALANERDAERLRGDNYLSEVWGILNFLREVGFEPPNKEVGDNNIYEKGAIRNAMLELVIALAESKEAEKLEDYNRGFEAARLIYDVEEPPTKPRRKRSAADR